MQEFYIGYKMEKPIEGKNYPEMASWCNSNNAWVEDKGDYCEICTWSESDRNKQKLKSELSQLEDYLNETDYMVIKCMERGLDMKSEYPLDYQKRQDARERINEIREELTDAGYVS